MLGPTLDRKPEIHVLHRHSRRLVTLEDHDGAPNATTVHHGTSGAAISPPAGAADHEAQPEEGAVPETPDSKTPTEPGLPRLLNITQVAEALGVEARHIRRLIHERRIPYIKWGHLIRFDPDDITTWLNLYRQPGRPSPTDGRRTA